MWDPQHLTTLRTFTACYRNSFTFLLRRSSHVIWKPVGRKHFQGTWECREKQIGYCYVCVYSFALILCTKLRDIWVWYRVRSVAIGILEAGRAACSYLLRVFWQSSQNRSTHAYMPEGSWTQLWRLDACSTWTPGGAASWSGECCRWSVRVIPYVQQANWQPCMCTGGRSWQRSGDTCPVWLLPSWYAYVTHTRWRPSG
jgi:hypothetical protein